MKRTMSWVFALVFSVIMMLWTLPSQAMAAEVQQPTKAEVAAMQLAQVQQPSKEEVKSAQGLYIHNLPEPTAAEESALVAQGVYIHNLPEPAAAEEGGVTPTAAGNVVYACVNANGTLGPANQRFGAISSNKVFTGEYDVRFNRNVRNCSYLATIGLCGFTGVTDPPGEISTVGRFGATNGVFVLTTNSTGFAQDKPFYLEVQCP